MKRFLIVFGLYAGYTLATDGNVRAYVQDKCHRVSMQLATDADAWRAFEAGDAVQVR